MQIVLLEKQGYKSLEKIADVVIQKLNEKQKEDEDNPIKIKSKEILFGCTGTIGETYPEEKIKNKIPELVSKLKYTQNKYIWMKAALGIMTTDTQPKMAMEECEIGSTKVKIFGIAKGSGMIQPNMGTTLGYIFTDANIPNDVLKKLIKKIYLQHLMLSAVMEIQVLMIWLRFFQQVMQNISQSKMLMMKN